MSDAYRKNPDVVFRKIADQFILVPIKQKVADLKSVYTLNETAAFIWERLDGKTGVSQIKDGLTQEFEIDPACAESDVRGVLAKLESLSLAAKV